MAGQFKWSETRQRYVRVRQTTAGAWGDQPTVADQIVKCEAAIKREQGKIALLAQLPDWAIVRTSRNEWKCAECQADAIRKGDIYVEDPRGVESKYDWREGKRKLFVRRICLACAPVSLSKPPVVEPTRARKITI